MRRLILLAVAVAAVALVPDQGASAQLPPGCRKARLGAVICDGEIKSSLRPGRPASVTPVTVYPYRERWRPVLTTADGARCIEITTERIGRDPLPAEDAQAEQQMQRLLRLYRLCPGATLPTTTPALEAAAFLERIQLPTPVPRVEPGRLPVGFEAFLETGAPTTQTFTTDTPFGPLVLTATAEIFVDWDDPHDGTEGFDGPYAEAPGPYPDGGIRHVYQYGGWYEIEVRYEWSAAWSIGAVSGVIDGVETGGTYPAPGFEAYSRQAVG